MPTLFEDQDGKHVHICRTQLRSSLNTKNTKFEANSPANINNLVYIMTSAIWNIQYGGETENILNTRCRGPESNIRNMTENPVSNHYGSYIHTIEDCMFFAVDKERDKDGRLRLEEACAILLDTLSSKGFNSRW